MCRSLAATGQTRYAEQMLKVCVKIAYLSSSCCSHWTFSIAPEGKSPCCIIQSSSNNLLSVCRPNIECACGGKSKLLKCFVKNTRMHHLELLSITDAAFGSQSSILHSLNCTYTAVKGRERSKQEENPFVSPVGVFLFRIKSRPSLHQYVESSIYDWGICCFIKYHISSDKRCVCLAKEEEMCQSSSYSMKVCAEAMFEKWKQYLSMFSYIKLWEWKKSKQYIAHFVGGGVSGSSAQTYNVLSHWVTLFLIWNEGWC